MSPTPFGITFSLDLLGTLISSEGPCQQVLCVLTSLESGPAASPRTSTPDFETKHKSSVWTPASCLKGGFWFSACVSAHSPSCSFPISTHTPSGRVCPSESTLRGKENNTGSPGHRAELRDGVFKDSDSGASGASGQAWEARRGTGSWGAGPVELEFLIFQVKTGSSICEVCEFLHIDN